MTIKCPKCKETERQILIDTRAVEDEDSMTYHTTYVQIKIYFCRSCYNIYGDEW